MADTMLLVDTGDLPSLAALALQPEGMPIVLWHLIRGTGGDAARRTVVEQHARQFAVERLVVSEEWTPGVETGRGRTDAAAEDGLEMSLALLQAVVVARRLGCPKVVWPVQVGLDQDRVCDAVDRATLITEMADLSGSAGVQDETERIRPGGLVIDVPLVDLDDDQIVDLVDDAGAPLDGFWPCEGEGPRPCGPAAACPGCERWRAAFDARGLAWPWSPSAVAIG